MVPNSIMCRRVVIAYFEMMVCPYGTSNWNGPRAAKPMFDVRRFFLRSARVVDPYDEDDGLHVPGLDRGRRVLDHELPGAPAHPGAVDPVGAACPQYSATSTGAFIPVPHEPKPSMSALVRPASAMARLVAW